ncbi:MAG: cation:proton antiporter [Prevotella sp.]|nr:cation:proton antiporter [Candidatus Prevotella equi]
MAEIPTLVQDLALILITAGIVTLIFKKLKQPLVLGYIMAGFIVSPNLPITYSVADHANIEIWASIGVIFLLFALGLDFSVKKILKMGMAPIIAAITIVFSMMCMGMLVGKLFGWTTMNGLFLAGMLAMSSTTIIYKAFDDLGLRQQQFSSLVMSVLILEDILAIVMMVVLATIAKGGSGDSGQMVSSLLNIGYFLVLWFVVGLFFIPILLRKVRKLVNEEVLLILALALCCGMAVFASAVGFSAAFGSFVMGSILAETIEAKKIEKLVEPVKNLFGAIFFVSVGMLVDITVVIEQWVAIIVITLAILVGQSIFGTFGFMLSGQPLKTAMRCGFSMAQIGEFAFIIATLGLSLGVVSDFVYPVVVTVSVITTFLTPYMIRGAIPVYNTIERRLPKVWIRRINKISDIAPSNYDTSQGYWRPLLIQMTVNSIIYSTISFAIGAIMLTVGDEFLCSIMPERIGSMVCAAVTIILMAPFLRAMVMKKNKSEEYKALWISSRHNRAPLVFTIIVRLILAMSFIFYTCYMELRLSHAFIICIAMVVILAIIYSDRVKLQSIRLERLFIQNLRSKEMYARATGERRPLFEGHLLDRDIHISQVTVPQDSTWAGKTLAQLNLARRFGVHVSSIHRGHLCINIPSGTDVLFPDDVLQVIGTDEQLTMLNAVLQQEVIQIDEEVEQEEMILRHFIIGKNSPFLGKTLITSGLRDHYNCMLIGLEENEGTLTRVTPSYAFAQGDLLWIVGEETNIQRLSREI